MRTIRLHSMWWWMSICRQRVIQMAIILSQNVLCKGADSWLIYNSDAANV